MATVKYSQSFQGREGARNPHTFPSRNTHTFLKEGVLYKRQRGRKSHDLRGLKFQQRYCVLAPSMFAYYSSKRDVGHEPSGSVPVAKIKVVEKVPEATFKKPCCIQVGNEKEIIYFCASSERDRDEWMEAFKIAAFGLRKNKPLTHYHTGAFGKREKNFWSCCNSEGKEAQGCVESTCTDSQDQREGSSPSLADSGLGLITDIVPRKIKSMSLPINSESIDPESQEMAWYSEIHKSDSEDESVVDDEPTTPTMYSSSQSLQSEDSGKGSSMFDLTSDSPAPGRRGKIAKHSTISSFAITEEDTHLSQSQTASTEVACPLAFTCKTTFDLEEGYSTSVLYRGADSVITTTNTGKVSLWSRLNTTKPQKQKMFIDNGVDPPSISAWGKNLVIGSSKLYFKSLEESRNIKCYNSSQDNSPKLVAFGPDGTLFFASKNGSEVDMLPLPQPNNEWPSVKASAEPTTIREVPGRIFSLAVSPHPNQPWLAVGYTSLKDQAPDFVSIFNYETRHYSKTKIEIGQHSGLCLAFTYDGQHLYVGSDLRIQSFNTETSRPAEFNYTFKEDGSVTAMCCSPVRHHLAVGLKSDEVKIFVGDPSQSAPVPFTIPDTKSSGAVTALSYSRDGMKTAVAFQNGSVRIWKASKPPEEQPLTRTGTLVVTDKGQTYHSKEDGYTITIPEGAVKPGTLVPLHYGVAPDSPYGPYEFKDGAQPVSTIISLCPEPADTVFLKPIEVTLPHFIACKTPEDCKKLFFYKAKHDNFRVEGGAKVYRFEKVTDGAVAHFSQYYKDRKLKVLQGAATLYTTHCCDLCIAKDYSEDDTSVALLSFRQIAPKYPDLSQEYKVYYCLLYLLRTCVQRVDEQYLDDQYDKEELVVSLPSEANKLQIHLSSGKLKGGWQLRSYPEQSQIVKEDLCFWKDHVRPKIEELVRAKLYPPKITLRVIPGERISEGVATTVSFSGVRGCLGGQTSFTLELVKPFQVDSSSAVPQRKPNHSFSSSATSFQSAESAISEAQIDKFQDNFDDIAQNVECKRLASALFSASSQRKCSYLDDEAVAIVRSFPKKAKGCSDKFSTNFDILTDAFLIATKFPQYISAISTALNRAIDDQQLKDRLGYSSSRHPSIVASQESTSSTVGNGYGTPAESLPDLSPSTPISLGNGFPYHQSNGILPRDQTQRVPMFSAQMGDPNI